MFLSKNDVISILSTQADELLQSNDRRRRAEGRKITEFLPIVEDVEFARIEARTTKNGWINLGDLGEQVAKLLDGYKGKYLKRGKANGYDGIKDGKGFEVKSHIINPSTPLQTVNKRLLVLTYNSLYDIDAETVADNLNLGERITVNLLRMCGLEPIAEW